MKHKDLFIEWIRTRGSKTLATELGVTQRTVYYWVAGKVRPTRKKRVDRILELAPHLTSADIMGLSR